MIPSFDRSPNIVLLTIDSLRTDHVGCYGGPNLTPEIDRLAGGGFRFDRAFINGIGTPKSFPAILAGSYPLSFGGPEVLSDSRTTVAEYLSEAGYTTVGRSTNHYLSYQANYHRGFDEFHEHYDLTRAHKEPLADKARQLHQDGHSPNDIETELGQKFHRHYRKVIEGCEDYLDQVDWESDDIVADHEELTTEFELLQEDFEAYLAEYCGIPASPSRRVLDRVESRLRSVASRSDLLVGAHELFTDVREKPYMSATRLSDALVDDVDRLGTEGEEPFFLWGHYMDVHTPFLPGDNDTWPEEYTDYLDEVGEDPMSTKAVDAQPDEFLQPLYKACVRYVDEQLGRVLDAIGDLDRPTLVLVTSDHGEEFWEHDGFGHDAKLYDELIHVPLVIGGDIDPDVSSDPRLVSHVDLLPTLLAPAVGAPVPDAIEGQNVFDRRRTHVVAETLRETGETSARHKGGMDIERDEKVIAVRTEEEKVIHYEQKDVWEYFDLDEDPAELNDLSDERTFESLRRIVDERLAAIDNQLDQATHVERSEIIEDRLSDLGYM
jgi:arylsulfatase A-like enzyme